MTLTTTSRLDTAQQSPWAAAPFFNQTVELLRSVRDRDCDSSAARCDDDFGIVDLDPIGNSVMIRTRAEWEAWFNRLFSDLATISASTDSEILDYQTLASDDMGFSVVKFRQRLAMGVLTADFDCVATIVWKTTSAGWQEARCHVSLLSTNIPEGFPVG